MACSISCNNVNKVHGVSPATKDNAARLFTPGVVVIVDGAEGSLGDRGHKQDVSTRKDDDLVEKY